MPPKIVQQHARPASPSENGQSVLSRIAPVRAVSVDRQKWALYGQPKTGKTRFACSFKKPLLLIGAEDGTASVAGVKGVEFVQVFGLGEVDELVREARNSGRWATVVVDTLSKLRDIRINELFKLRGGAIPDKKPFMFAGSEWKDVWTQTGKDLRDSLRPLLDAPRVMDVNVIVISQEANLVYDDGQGGAGSTILKPSMGSAVGKSLAEWLHAECDYIGQTLIRNQTTELKIEGMEPQQVQTGVKEYCLRVMPDGVYQAGFRLPEGRVLQDEFIVNPSYAKVCALIKGPVATAKSPAK